MTPAGRAFQSLPEPARACPLPEPARPLPEPARACQSLAEPARACQSLPWPGLAGPLPGLPRPRAWLARACQSLRQGRPRLRQKGAGPTTCHRSCPDLFKVTAFLRALPRSQSKAPFQSLSRLPRAFRPPKPFEGFLGSRRVFAGGSISASCAERPSIFSSTFSIFEAFCVARPHASWPDPAPFHTSRDVFSYIRRSRRSVSCARYSGSDAAHRQWRRKVNLHGH